MSVSVVPLPPTRSNLAVGAGWTVLIFVGTVCVITAALTGGIGAIFALIIAGVLTLLATPVLGIPLTILAARILRNSPSTGRHLIGQFLAGAIAALVTCVIGLWFVGWSAETWLFVATGAVAVIGGASSAAGWYIALKHYRGRDRPDRFGTADEDFD